MIHGWHQLICLVPHSFAVTCTCQVRNHILARWRADVTQYLPEQEAASKILPKHRHLVSTAWRYLDHHGYINWGVAPAVMGRPADEHEETVVVIGAGLAGGHFGSQQ